MSSLDSLTIQKVQVLMGERGDGREAAARMKHLQALFQNTPSEPSAKLAAGSAPTKAEYDALVRDVQAIFSALNSLRTLLR